MGSDYKNATQNYLQRTSAALQQMNKVTETATNKLTGVVIMSEIGMADWAAGKETCVRDYIVSMNGVYGFDGLEVTWTQLQKEQLLNVNPDFIIVVSNSYKGQSGYNQMIDAHKNDWQTLKAFKNDKIFLLYDQANNTAQRLGPRFVECAELFAKYMYPDQFNGQPKLPRYIGDEYVDYLTYTKGIVS